MTALEVDDRNATRAERLPPPSLWELVEESGLGTVVVGVSKDPNAKVSVLLVSPVTGRPELVVKVPTSRGAGLAVERERRTLDAVRELLPERLRATLPRPVQIVDFDGRPAMVETAIPGTPMTVSYLARRHTADPRRVAADLNTAGAWLAALQQETTAAAAPIGLAAGLHAPLRRRYPDERVQGELFDCLAELDARLSAQHTPRTVVHGDFWFGNVLLSDGRLSGVVDWEAATISGEPVRDLARFALSYALYLDRRTRRGRPVAGHPGLRADRWGAAVEYALDGRGWFPELFREFLEDGLRRLDAPGALWRDVALAGVAEVAAFSDDDDFARRHLELFRRLATRRSRGGTA
jgi:aminoglycoside phosphotransferase (APT) family kinase protein